MLCLRLVSTEIKNYLPHSHPLLQLLGIWDLRGTHRAPVHLFVGTRLQIQVIGKAKDVFTRKM